MESNCFTSDNGNTLYAVMLKPKEVATPKACILFLHGNAGNFLSQLAFAIPLVKQGFQLLLVDYSGYGFSSGRPTRKGILVDAESALRYLKSKEEVKNTKVIIYGQSMGAQLAATVAKLHPDDIDALVLEGSPSSHKDIAAYRFKRISGLARLLVHERYSAKSSVRDFHKPILIIHSSQDQDAPFSMGQKVYKNANTPKEFYEIKGAHLYGPVTYPDSIAAKIARMISK
jgi:pimeloyl-ACP methyl ester carboxylesterase